MIETACAFTGHRPKSFPWGYDENAPGYVLLKEVLAAQITALAERGVTDFLSGMAQETDLWCAQIVLDLRKKNTALKLHAILPCEGQDGKWTASAQVLYHSILEQADDVFFVDRDYCSGCMLKRNRCMVDHSSILLAVYNGTRRSGTDATVNYSRRLGRKIIVIDPISRNISHQYSGNI